MVKLLRLHKCAGTAILIGLKDRTHGCTMLYPTVPNCTQLYPTPLRETRPETSLVQLGSLSRSDRLIEKLRATPSPKSVDLRWMRGISLSTSGTQHYSTTYIGCVTCVALPWRALCLGFLAFFPVWRNLSHDLNFSWSSGCSMSPCTTHTQRSVFSLFKRGIPVWCSSLHVTLSNWINWEKFICKSGLRKVLVTGNFWNGHSSVDTDCWNLSSRHASARWNGCSAEAFSLL